MTARPFLLVATRTEDEVADEEYEAFARFLGVPHRRLHRLRLESEPMPSIDLDRYAGVLTGGSPFNSSDTEKSPLQQRVESDLGRLLDELVARDFPFLGACYGVGTLGVHQGAVVDRTYGEVPGAGHITLTEVGRRDRLCAGVPEDFDAFLGHKEAVRTLPPHAVLLATSGPCPVQMFKVRTNLYATQFHPELDAEGLASRLGAYRDHGYFAPHELDRLVADARAASVTHPQQILANFAALFG